MRILKPGTLRRYVYHGTCGHCLCMVEAEQDEVTSRPGRYNDTDYSVKCPTEGCRFTISVTQKERGRSR